MMNGIEPILVNGEWKIGQPVGTFHAENPSLSQRTTPVYPISSREDVLAIIEAGAVAAEQLWKTPPETIAQFLRRFADSLEQNRTKLVDIAHEETGFAKEPRLNHVELPRTIDQLRQAAESVEKRSWTRPVIDRRTNIRSMFGPLHGPVVVMGPNNFPFAFNSAAGGDFAAAIAARNPVIAKANPSHPGTTKRLTELAHQSALDVGLHPASLQLLYHVPQEVGFEMVSHSLVGATAFTGSRFAGLRLKERADRAGKPIYLEMSSINSVVMLPGALSAKADLLAEEFSTSCLMGAGQFCTNPGLIFVQAAPAANRFLGKATERFESTPPGVILGKSSLDKLGSAIRTLVQHGAKILTGGNPVAGTAYRFENTLLQVDGAAFLESPEELQTEAFGPVSLVVIVDNLPQLRDVLGVLGGNLTGSIYSSIDGSDENVYQEIEPILRRKVGRLLNDKMPTGVAVSPAMNHGGPFPATGHPGFTAVGLPYSIQRFAALYCYDNCRSDHLPPELRDENPLGVDQHVKAD